MVPREQASGEGSFDVFPGTGRLRFRIAIDGTRLKPIYQRKNESDAQFRKRAKKLKRDALASAGRDITLTVAEVVGFYLNRAQLAPKTVEFYDNLHRNHISEAPRFGRLAAYEIRPLQIEADYEWLMANGRSPDMVKKCHALLRKSFNHGLKYELVSENPFLVADPPKVRRQEKPHLDKDEIRRFIKAAQTDSLFELFFLALVTGARMNELLSLDWTDIDLNGRKIHFRGTKTKNANRTVLIDRTTADLLREYRGDRIGLVFCTANGNKLNPANIRNRHLQPILKRAKISKPITFHSLRHTAAFVALGTLRENTILERFGWSDMPDTYKHWKTEAQNAEIDKLTDLL